MKIERACRWRWMRRMFAFSLLCAAGAPLAGPPRGVCEPAAPLDLSARVLGREDRGSTVRVTFELAVRTPIELEALRVRGSLSDRRDAGGATEVPERILALDSARTARYTLELERGREHHLLLSVETGDGDRPLLRSTAYVRVNLDPALDPVVVDRVLQYRARMRSEPDP